MVLGLSLTSDDVVWVLVDEADGTVIDHDVIEVHDDAEMAGAAARGAHAIATNGGFDVASVRLTWRDDVAEDGVRLRTRLSACGFREVEAVPFSCAITAMVHPDTEPGLALAYGAAVATVDPSEAITAPVVQQASARRGFSRTRFGAALLGAAAAAALGGLLLSAGSGPAVERTAVAAAAAPQPDPGWVAVPVPASSDGAASTLRKVVESPEDTAEAISPPAAVAVRQVQPVAPAPAALPTTVPTGIPHLPESVPHLAAPAEAPVVMPPAEVPAAAPMAVPAPEAAPAPVAAPALEAVPTGEPHLPAGQPELPSAPEMTDPAILFTALP